MNLKGSKAVGPHFSGSVDLKGLNSSVNYIIHKCPVARCTYDSMHKIL